MRRLAVILLLAFVAAAPARAAAPPGLDLVLTPRAAGGPDSRMDVRMTFERPDFKAGDGLVRLPLSLVGIPSVRLDGEALTARDDAGPIPLAQSEEPPTPQGTYRRWSVTRPTLGDVVVSYSAPPRAVTAATNNGPLFDLREEAGGFAGAGVGFLVTPVAPGPWKVRLAWDLSAAPSGSRGASTLGDGTVEAVLPSQALAFSYYAAGPLKTYPEAPGGFSLYWLGEPPFDAKALAQRVEALFKPMAAFFGDADPTYRVFMRQNPYKAAGGSGLGRSFMFGYHPAAKPTVDDLQGLLAHEIAHKWPAMQGEHGDTAWYSEGTAEFYSVLLSHRAGLLPPERFLATINEKALAYYTNPYRALSNPEAARRFWTDPIAQNIPYGRGFMYLVNVDAEIREASGGRRSLDDVVKELHRRQTAGEAYGVAQWLELVGREIGAAAAKAGYDAMVEGRLLTPAAARFAPCFKVEPRPTRPLRLGIARSAFNDDRVVRGLEPGGPAERAGVRDGDVIVEASDLDAVRKDETALLTLVLRRDGALRTVTYLPRGPAQDGYRWVRDPAAPADACRF